MTNHKSILILTEHNLCVSFQEIIHRICKKFLPRRLMLFVDLMLLSKRVDLFSLKFDTQAPSRESAWICFLWNLIHVLLLDRVLNDDAENFQRQASLDILNVLGRNLYKPSCRLFFTSYTHTHTHIYIYLD